MLYRFERWFGGPIAASAGERSVGSRVLASLDCPLSGGRHPHLAAPKTCRAIAATDHRRAPDREGRERRGDARPRGGGLWTPFGSRRLGCLHGKPPAAPSTAGSRQACKMRPPTSLCALGSEFDDFLFAAIAADCNGMPLTVVSALARMDLDPWHEAAGLAEVPVEAATAKLTSLLDALPGPTLQYLDLGTTAARLIALLPRPPRSSARSPVSGAHVAGATHRQACMSVILIVLYMILILGTQFVVMRLPPATHADTARASAPTSASGKSAEPAAPRGREL